MSTVHLVPQLCNQKLQRPNMPPRRWVMKWIESAKWSFGNHGDPRRAANHFLRLVEISAWWLKYDIEATVDLIIDGPDAPSWLSAALKEVFYARGMAS